LEGEAQIGSWVRFHSNVHLCRGSWVGDLVWIFPNAITTNDPIPPSGLCHGPRIGHGAAVCTGSVVLPRSIIGDGAFIGAMTRVGGEVPSGALVVGNPGQVVGRRESSIRGSATTQTPIRRQLRIGSGSFYCR
jgi:acetyltransferase-like isoleucine patch superfamily enzyme